jgi:hypothetical protein
VIRKSVVILPCGVCSDVAGDEAVEKVAGVLAADLHYAPIGKKSCFHALGFLERILAVPLELIGQNVSD